MYEAIYIQFYAVVWQQDELVGDVDEGDPLLMGGRVMICFLPTSAKQGGQQPFSASFLRVSNFAYFWRWPQSLLFPEILFFEPEKRPKAVHCQVAQDI